MNARSDFAAVADAPSDLRATWPVLLGRWRTRLTTWRRPLRVMLPMACPLSAFEAWAAQHEGAAVELSLSSQSLLMLADDAAADAQALRERAIERWTHYLDLPAGSFDEDWLVQTTLDRARAPVSVACALSRSFHEALRQVARRHGLNVVAIQPWWAEGLQQAWRALPALSDGGGGASTDAQGGGQQRRCTWREGAWQTQAIVDAEGGRWVLRSLAWASDASDGASDQVDPLADQAFDAPAMPEAAATMQPPSPPMGWRRWRAGSHPTWAESLNFAGPRVRASFWSWALLALGLIASVHALELSSQVDEAQGAAQAELLRLRAHVAAPVPPKQVAPDASTAVKRDEKPIAVQAPALPPQAWSSAAQLAAWLGHPWAAVLDHVDATAHQRGIALIRFQLDLGTWGTRAEQALSWRAQAAVPDDEAALAWVQALGPQAELQRRDALAQPVPSERGTLTWRIDVSASGGRP